MERIFYVNDYNLDQVNSALEKGGRVKMISVVPYDSGAVGAFIVVEYDD